MLDVSSGNSFARYKNHKFFSDFEKCSQVFKKMLKTSRDGYIKKLRFPFKA